VSEHSLTYSPAVVKTLPKPTRAPALAPEARRAALVDEPCRSSSSVVST